MRPSTIAGIVVVAVVVVAVVVGISLRPAASSGSKPEPNVGHPAPDFALHDAIGTTVSLGGQQGHPVLLNFWATWCIPCRTEMPLISRTLQKHPDLRVLAVDLQEPSSDVRAFKRDYHLDFTPLLDSSGTVWDLYHLTVNGPKPVTFWVDSHGVIRAVHYGQMQQSDVTAGLAKIGA